MYKSKKQRKREVVKKYSMEETREIVLTMAKTIGDIDYSLKEIGEEILPKLKSEDKKEKEEIKNRLNKKSLEVMFALEGETHIALMESFDGAYRGLARELSKRIIEENRCKTFLEKSLVEIIVNSYIRIIDNSKRFNNCANTGEYITENRTKYLAMLSKQIDRSNRQFISSLVTLKQIKSPPIKMNIKTNNAFVSKNQQFNAIHKKQ